MNGRSEGERERAVLARLVGQRITGAEVGPDGTLNITLGNGEMCVLHSDPEGNGPGALHVYSGPEFVGIVGGR